MEKNNMQTLKIPKLYYNLGCTAEALKDLKENNIKKICILSDSTVWGIYGKKLSSILKSLNIKFILSIKTDLAPSDKTIDDYINIAQAYRPDAILGFGGDAIINASKLFWFKYENQNKKLSDLNKKRISNMSYKSQLIAIQTLADGGDEMSSFAKFTNENNEIEEVTNNCLIPSMSIIDAQFQSKIPKSIIAYSGMHALGNAFDSFISTKSNQFTMPFIEESLTNFCDILLDTFKSKPMQVSKIKMAHKTTLIGISSSNAGLGLLNSLSFSISNTCGIKKGLIHSVLLPKVIALYGKDQLTKKSILNIGKKIVFSDSLEVNQLSDLIKNIELLQKKLDLPISFDELGISQKINDNINVIINQTLNSIHKETTSIQVTEALIKSLL